MSLLPAIVAAMVIFPSLVTLQSCGEEKKHYVADIGDGDLFPNMITDSVETFISDSGYTRYHITAPIWKMYDHAQEPFWKFDEGLELETYDPQLKPESFLSCDSAIYWTRLRRWRLDGNVEMMNTAKDSFLTAQLYYDDLLGKAYTDSFIHIVKADRIIEGYGFESNRELTSYTLHRPTAIIPLSALGIGKEEKNLTVKPDSAEAVTAEPRRKMPAPVRASTRNKGRLPEM